MRSSLVDHPAQPIYDALCEHAESHSSLLLRLDGERAAAWIELRLGQICAATAPGILPTRKALRRRLLELLDDAIGCEACDEQALPAGAFELCPPLSPHALVRQHLRRVDDDAIVARYEALLELADLRPGPRQPPLWLLDSDEARVADALAAGAGSETLAQAWRGRRVDLLRLLALLDASRAITAHPVSPRSVDHAKRLLGINSGTLAPDVIRAAFRQAALRWHPDRHPDADEQRRATLAARFSVMSSAYRVLLDT
ncbi:MAG: J domain-containing protein [Myxococcales bacterium]|nr:J domain-containing protein [Myxococcales bacterium]